MASTFTINADTSAASARLKRIQWNTAANEWAKAVGPELTAAIKRQAPVGQGPGAGRLRDATTWRHTSAPGVARLEFRANNVPYVPYVLEPTRPHTIVPRAARALAWTPAGGGGMVFARRVNHPGTKGNNYPARAYMAMRSEIIRAFQAAIEKML